jgi:metallo-beta-lactamase class B
MRHLFPAALLASAFTALAALPQSAPAAGYPAETAAPPPARAHDAGSPNPPSKPTQAKKFVSRFEIRELSPGISIITHSYPYAANSVLVEVGASDLVLVDTTYTPEAATRVLDWIEKTYAGKRKLTAAINTHFHVDRIGGNAALIERGVPVHGSDAIPRLLAERGEAMRAMMIQGASSDEALKDAYKSMTFTPPNQLFALKQGKTLKIADQEIQILFTGPGHAPDNVVVYFPSLKLLAGGCMILAGPTTGNTSDAADIDRWADSVKALSKLPLKYVIPGHGNETSPTLIQHTLRVLALRKGKAK